MKEACINILTVLVDGVVYLLGPVLICFALAITSGLSYTFFYVMLPMLIEYNKNTWMGKLKIAAHISYVAFILVNVLYNYALCVMTRNKGPHFDKVVRELAVATGFNYPETPAEVAQAKRDHQEKMFFYTQRRQARERRSVNNAAAAAASTSPSGGTVTQRLSSTAVAPSSSSNNNNASSEKVHRWTLMAPDEWGFCNFSNQPKPPRSHYDHVMKCLVLNMDHYCPWMFNTVGYFNYRYFCNFLFYVSAGMLYGAILTLVPFLESSGSRRSNYMEQLRYNRAKGSVPMERLYPLTPFPGEKAPIALSFMMCLALGLAVTGLAGFHLYLMLSAQTTIEFHGNCASKRRAKKQKRKFVNPYDLGTRRNWQQVYGTRHPLLAILPSSREPEFLPLPTAGDRGVRPHHTEPFLPQQSPESIV